MASELPAYRRITGHGMGLAVYARLYQGPDHFLQISSTGFTETYKRFYFRDIQAIVLERKPWRLAWSGLFVGLILLFIGPAVTSTGVWAAINYSMAAVAIVALVVNWALGPTCSCYIRTAVQTERLRNLTRLRKGRAFIKRAAELVAPHQATQATPLPAGTLASTPPPAASAADAPS